MSNIAAESVGKSGGDGYTWLATSVPFATSESMVPRSALNNWCLTLICWAPGIGV